MNDNNRTSGMGNEDQGSVNRNQQGGQIGGNTSGNQDDPRRRTQKGGEASSSEGLTEDEEIE